MKATVAAWDVLSKAEKQLCRVKSSLSEGRMHQSKRGVPILVVRGYYSVAYFCKTKSFKVFDNWGNFDATQRHKNFKVIAEVVEYLEGALENMDDIEHLAARF